MGLGDKKYWQDVGVVSQKRKRAKELGLKAPKGFWSIELEDLFEMVGKGGCGPGGIGDYFVSDHILGIDVSPGCIIHDYEYATGKIGEDKFYADARLKMNLYILIDNSKMCQESKSLDFVTRSIANGYYTAVRDFGGKAFWTDKEQLPTKKHTMTVSKGTVVKINNQTHFLLNDIIIENVGENNYEYKIDEMES